MEHIQSNKNKLFKFSSQFSSYEIRQDINVLKKLEAEKVNAISLKFSVIITLKNRS